MIQTVVYKDLKEEAEHLFKLDIFDAAPIHRGWLNMKWKLETSKGMFLIKQYNRERYKMYDPIELQYALAQQQFLYEKNIPCPYLLTCDNRLIHKSSGGERFVCMEFKEGETVASGKVTSEQMYELGTTIGKIHQLLNDNTSQGRTPIFKAPSLDASKRHWVNLIHKAKLDQQDYLVSTFEQQLHATEDINLSEILSLETGWAHRDMWVDNILFKENQLSAILDYDRLNYDFPDLDLARAVMSCCLDNKTLKVEPITSMLEGYRQVRSYPKGKIILAIQLLWYMESKWWIHQNLETSNATAKRFAVEMIWLSEHMKDLNDLLAEI